MLLETPTNSFNISGTYFTSNIKKMKYIITTKELVTITSTQLIVFNANNNYALVF